MRRKMASFIDMGSRSTRHRRHVQPLRALAALLATAALAACGSGPSEESASGKALSAQRPNILYILADDLGYSDIGTFGGEIPTPNLDALARGGMLLTDFYTGMTCSPTRAMLMSGMDHHLAGLALQGAATRPEHIGKPGYEGYLNFRVASLADLMTDAGYNTYMTGKWHLGEEEEHGPKARGFKRSFVSLDGAAHLGGWDWRGPQPARYRDDGKLVQVGDDWYTTRDYTHKMIEYIKQDRAEGKPFFAWLAYTAPHWPLQAPDESIAKFKGWYDDGYEALYAKRFAQQKALGLVPPDAKPIDNARFSPRWNSLTAEQKRFEARRMEIYAAMVSDLDRYVGEVVAYLKESGQFDNTFIMFSSDNGAESARRDLIAPIADHIGKEYDHSLENLGRANTYVMYGANWASVGSTPFNRYKATAFEGGAHVPAFVHFPVMVKPGTRGDGVGTVRDLLPTFLALAGGELPGSTYKGREVLPVQGRSLLPLLKGEVKEVHPADTDIGFELLGHRGLRQGDWKIVWDQAAPAAQRKWLLFNLVNDPFEQTDLSAAQPQRLAAMRGLWDRYEKDHGIIY
jgi:arylsulfatase A-like enzyme